MRQRPWPSWGAWRALRTRAAGEAWIALVAGGTLGCAAAAASVVKVAAYYVQSVQDEVVLGAVNEIEDLTNGLSRKIWQKLMVLDQIRRTPSG